MPVAERAMETTMLLVRLAAVANCRVFAVRKTGNGRGSNEVVVVARV